MTVIQIEVETDKSLEETADYLAIAASAVFDRLFPEQWEHAMAVMAARIGQTAREADPPGLTVVADD
jgi:hypothetical protein